MKGHTLMARSVGVAVMVGSATFVAGSLSPANAAEPPTSSTSSTNLLREYLDVALDARHSLGIPDTDHTLTDNEYAKITAIANVSGKYDSLLTISHNSGPGGANRGVTPQDDSPSSGGPGPEQTKVCISNPIDCPRALSARDDSYNESAVRYPTFTGVDDRRDAFRHCTWQALTTKRSNADFATQLGDAHERDGDADGTGNPAANEMDQANNATGRQVGLENENTPDSAIYDRCGFLADTGGLRTLV